MSDIEDQRAKEDAIEASKQVIKDGYSAWKRGELTQEQMNSLLLADGCLRWGI